MLMMRERVKNSEMIVRDLAAFKEPPFKTPQNLMRNYGTAVGTALDVARQIQGFMNSAYQAAVPIPEVETAGADVAALPYEEALATLKQRHDTLVQKVATMFDCPRIGRFEWLSDDAARFSYVTVRRERGLLKVRDHRNKHVHDLVKAVSHPFADEIPIRDPRAKQLIDMIPSSLKPYGRIIAGLEIVKGHEFAGTDETLTGLGRIVHGAKQAVVTGARSTAESGRKAATVIARGAGRTLSSGSAWTAAGIGAAVLGTLGLLATMAQVVIADPALVIGEYVLYGWED